MTQETENAPKTVTGVPQATHDAAVKAARDEGFNAGKAAGIEEGKALGAEEAKAAGFAAATTRIAAILDHENAKGREQLARHLAFKTAMSPEDAAAAMEVAALDTNKPGSLSQQMQSAPATATGQPPASAGQGAEPVNKFERGKALAMAALGKKSA